MADSTDTQVTTDTHTAFTNALHTQRVWTGELPTFDPGTAPADPTPLFHDWFLAAVTAAQPEPHTMTLATTGTDGLPDARVVMLHDADSTGWHFASHATSTKGRQLAAHPAAALCFYWPALARQVRVRGTVAPASAEESRADLAARTRGALAAALTGHQSEPLDSAEDLARAADAAWERAGAEPDAVSPTWTRYVLTPHEVEFFQGDPARRHVRLRYTRTAPGTAWTRGLLWP
ncbi:pyridoxal 5'-phosphate synthase [Streptomyces bambusae]|uniref:pyridoxine/pyridoxamine 5'-phosphate oxidase n=1 Tax=Streptomyces bambusae TaxID=1550616 RepID=UPI001CFF27A5|nr:pyridoxal 5'-phosphate synthase [Streptomyces bambusae]MCB5167566.1 pyridoxal 5'-phosphate synthase [Streptomyces bambusae]